MLRRAVYIPRQLQYRRLAIRSPASAVSQHPNRQFHATPQRRSGGNQEIQTAKMRDDAKDNPVSSSNSHLDSSFADDPDSRHMHEDDSWKFRAPYQIQKDDEFGPVKWEAMCHCGNVQYQIKQERPLAAKYCHCRACQVLHGIAPPQDSKTLRVEC